MHVDKQTQKCVPVQKKRMNNIKVQCRNCSEILCNVSDLAYRAPSYYCISKHFSVSKVTVNYQKSKFNCSNPTCGKELGQFVLFKGLNIQEAFILQIKAIKFEFPDKTIKLYNQWSKIEFEIEKMQS
jgi:hypothetical protein